MRLSDQDRIRLEEALQHIIREWYMHIEEYPYLYKYIAASLIQTGIVDEGASKRLTTTL
ncbi:MAG: hypothetical protein HZB84_00185 [Deltaproteobacteria bacterium]|nr:hypothetical protein [Deltaproteobacteria bacterium]